MVVNKQAEILRQVVEYFGISYKRHVVLWVHRFTDIPYFGYIVLIYRIKDVSYYRHIMAYLVMGMSYKGHVV